jgi:hypothetical protein
LLGFTRTFEAPVRIDYRFTSNVSPMQTLRIILDTLAVFYRRYILGTYQFTDTTVQPTSESGAHPPLVDAAHDQSNPSAAWSINTPVNP